MPTNIPLFQIKRYSLSVHKSSVFCSTVPDKCSSSPQYRVGQSSLQYVKWPPGFLFNCPQYSNFSC